jgi:hypothetical protein
MGQGGRSGAREVVVIARRERERGGCQGSHQLCHLEVSYEDGHTTMLNRGG